MAAHAIAHQLGKKLLIVDYSQIESKYVGETAKNLVAMFPPVLLVGKLKLDMRRYSADKRGVIVGDKVRGLTTAAWGSRPPGGQSARTM